MLSRSFLPGLILGTALVACGGKVVIDGAGGGTTTTGTGGAGGCAGDSFGCAQFCGSDFFPANAECVNGTWQCPAGTVDPKTCGNACGGPPAGACDVCDQGQWFCKPDVNCLSACPAIACGSCNGVGVASPECDCECAPNGTLVCTKTAPACCTADFQCGDEIFVPCVNGVCKPVVPNGCWSDEQCDNGLFCLGVSVCPCGQVCDEPDHPGVCAPAP
jgi:hypothetical protein